MKMDNYTFKILSRYFLLGLLACAWQSTFAQSSYCDSTVPLYTVDFTGKPDGVWTSPDHIRKGKCCSANSDDVCTSFNIILDTSTVAIKIDIISGAVPPGGTLYYQTSCGTKYPVGQEICFSGVGPHFISFCKPGNNPNMYRISTISKPLFPVDNLVIEGCSKRMLTYGLDSSTTTWNSIYPGNPGDYNHYLSCSANCTDPLVTPDANYPGYVDYLVCGYPASTGCGYSGQFCDTFRVFFYPEILVDVLPGNDVVFCDNSPGIQLTGSASGGTGSYIFTWKDNQGNVVANGPGYFASTDGIYTFEVQDSMPGEACIKTQNVTVSKSSQIIANAGPDFMVCAQSPAFELNGSISDNSPGSWFGGKGVFTPSNNILNATYTPSADELSNGFVELVLKPDNSYPGCANIFDTLKVSFSIEPDLQIISSGIQCNGDIIELEAQASGGYGTYTYLWNTNETSTKIMAGAGSYSIIVTDDAGCMGFAEINLTEPEQLVSQAKINPVKCSKNNGEIMLETSGGTGPYTYSWSNGKNTPGVKELSEGTYTVTVSDQNGCKFELKADVDKYPDMAVQSEVKGISCHGQNNGSITVMVTAGSGPYTYKWSNGNTKPSITGMKAGEYSLTITDAQGCNLQQNFVIGQPGELTNSFEYSLYDNNFNISTFKGNDGYVKSIVIGGTEPYAWEWLNYGNSSEINNLAAGEYEVLVTDANGCTTTGKITLKEPLEIEIPNVYTPNGDGLNDAFVIKGLENLPKNQFIVLNRWGKEVFNKENYANNWTGLSSNGEQLVEGTYFIVLKVNINGEDQVFNNFVQLLR